MTLTRQRHDGTSQSPSLFADLPRDCGLHSTQINENATTSAALDHSSAFSSSLLQRAACGVLSASLCVMIAMPAAARTRKIVGVPGWTRGSQTYLRSRPGEQTLPVAKVPRHTKVYVWGTFNGWYRVETPDHIFGWVHHSVLNAPASEKLIELSHRKAILASDRTASQKMFGSPEAVQRFSATKAKSSTRNVVAKTPTTALTKVSDTDDVPEKTLAERAADVRALELRTAAAKAELGRAQKAATQAQYIRVQQNNTKQLSAAQALAREKAIKLEQQRIAKAQADTKLAEAARQSRWAQQQLDRQTRLVQAEKARQNRVVAYKTQLTNHQINEEARRQNRIARWKARQTAHQNRLAWRQQQKRDKQQRLAMERVQLRKTLGTQVSALSNSGNAPNPTENLRPLTPAELMKARNEYLNGQRKSQPAVATSGNANAALDNSPLNSSAPTSSPADESDETTNNSSGVQATPSSTSSAQANSSMLLMFTAKAPVPATTTTTQVKTTVQTVTKTTRKAVKSEAKTDVKSGPRVLSYRGGSPMMRTMNRGGSPRDYARLPGATPRLGQGMVSQALSYRGMPYIMGAASPSRGFDCSGLIYFMLRQRGYNPPRTAEGLSRFGISVSRDHLEPGDILLFANTYKRGISHAGIYMGNGNFVHAANRSRGVSTNSLSERYYAGKYWGARRVK